MSRRLSLVVFLLLGCAGVDGWRDQSADLSLVLEASPNPVLPGGSITFVLTATNAGSAPAHNVSASVEVPETFSPVSTMAPAGWTTIGPFPFPIESNTGFHFEAGALGAGRSVQFIVTFTAPVEPAGSFFQAAARA